MTHTRTVTDQAVSGQDLLAVLAQRQRRGVKARRADDDSRPVRERWAVLIIVAVWGWTVGPRVIQTLTAPKLRSSVGEQSVDSPLAALATLLFTVVLLGLCALVALVASQYHHPGHVGVLALMIAPWFYLVVRDLFAGDRPTMTALVYPAVVVALWLLRPRFQVLVVLGHLLSVTAAMAMLLGALLPAKGIFYTAPGELALADKAMLPIGVLVGFLSHGNTLGTFLALSLPIVSVVPGRWTRRALMALCLLALVWSSSRGAVGAVALGVLAAVMIRAVPRTNRRAITPAIALLPFLAMGAVPFVTHDQTAFTNRGFIWAHSLAWWRDSPWFGLGSDWYNQVGQTSARLASTAFHGHNQVVQLLVTGGVGLVLLVGLMIFGAAVRAGGFAAEGRTFGIVYLTVLAGCSVLEKPLTFVDNYSMFPVVVLPLAILVFAERSEDGSDPSPDPSTSVCTQVLGDPVSVEPREQSGATGDVALVESAGRHVRPEARDEGQQDAAGHARNCTR